MPPMTDEDERTTTASPPQDEPETSTETESQPVTDDAGSSDVYTADLDDDDAAEQAEGDGEAEDAEAQPTEGDGETGEASGAVPEAAGATPEPPKVDPPQPWRANLYGQEAEPIPGALYKPGVGVLVPEAKLGQLTALVARGAKYEEFKRERQDAARAVEQAVAPVQFEAQALAEVVGQFLSPEFYAQFGLTPDLAEPYIKDLQFRLREKALERREKFGTTAGSRPTTDAPAGAELDPYDAQATVQAEVAEVLKQADYHGVFSASDVQAIGSRLTALNPFVQDEQGHWYLDRKAVAEAIALAAEPRRQLAAERQAQEAQRQASEAAKRNRAVTGQTTPTPAKRPAPKAVSSFDGKPWENPALSRDERRALWLKAHGG